MIRFKTILIGLILFSCLAGAGFAQDNYAIIHSERVSNLAPYTDALDNMDLERYRADEERRILRFTSGLEVVLYSRSEIKRGISPSKASPVSEDVRILKLGSLIIPYGSGNCTMRLY